MNGGMFSGATRRSMEPQADSRKHAILLQNPFSDLLEKISLLDMRSWSYKKKR
jgi:hypothetical protein